MEQLAMMNGTLEQIRDELVNVNNNLFVLAEDTRREQLRKSEGR